MGKPGGKRKVYFTCSTGKTGDGKSPAIEHRVGCPWSPGKSKKKFK